jgi:AcrR family transcriptional regulator
MAKPTGQDGANSSTRQAILDAARDLFTTHGYTGTSMTDIVQKAGTSVGLPYYHFGSKEKIFFALWSEFFVAQQHHFVAVEKAAAANGITGGWPYFLTGSRSFLEGAWEIRDLTAVMYGNDLPAGFAELKSQVRDKWVHSIVEQFSEEHRAIGRAAVFMVAHSIAGACHELAKLDDDAEATELIEGTFELWSAMVKNVPWGATGNLSGAFNG